MIPVAFVELVTVAVVSCDVKMNELGSVHWIFDVDPLNEVPVNVTVSPGHPVVGETDVRCHADAAWALPRNTKRPITLATRLKRLENRRGSAAVPCMASLRLRIRSPPGMLSKYRTSVLPPPAETWAKGPSNGGTVLDRAPAVKPPEAPIPGAGGPHTAAGEESARRSRREP